MIIFNSKKSYQKGVDASWGYPVGLHKSSSWKRCPEIVLPDNVDQVRCAGSTCLSVCSKALNARFHLFKI